MDGWMDYEIRVEALQWEVINEVKIVTQVHGMGLLVQRGNWGGGIGIELRTRNPNIENRDMGTKQQVLKRLITFFP
jgi:hypothetical protein